MRDSYSSKIPKSLIPYTLPSNWTWFFWSDIMKSYQQGMIRSNRELGEGNVYYLKMGDLNDNGVVNLTDLSITNATEKEIKEFQLTEGDFLINVRNSRELVGKTCVIRKIDKTILYNHMLVRINNGSPEMNYFINAFLNIPSSKKLLDRIKQGTTTVIALYQRELNQLPIPLPDTLTFNTIISLYKSIDAKIELNNRINRELEAMEKTLYDYWFVQFDFPVRTLSGVEGYKSSGGKMVYNPELKREIPEGWDVKKLGECIKIFDSQRIPLSNKERELKKGKIPYYGATGIMDYVNDFIFNDDYILLAEDGSVMNEDGFPIIQFIWGKTWVNNHAHVIQSKDKEQNEFYYQHLSMIPVILIKTGSIQMKINQDNLKNYHIIVPPNNLINRYSRFANSTRKSLINNIEQIQQLSSLRDWLLPMLMNGQVVSTGSTTRVPVTELVEGMAAEPSVEYKKG